jgi:hypothetical protein
MNQAKRYSLQASNSFLYLWLSLVLVFNLGLFVIIYFLINPIVKSSSNPNLYDKIQWASFVALMFLLFAITYVTINRARYWIDTDYIEKWSIYRPKKKVRINYSEINDIKLRRFPVLGDALNIGTIILYNSKNGKRNIILRIIGIKFPYEVYIDILEHANIEDPQKRIEDVLL